MCEVAFRNGVFDPSACPLLKDLSEADALIVMKTDPLIRECIAKSENRRDASGQVSGAFIAAGKACEPRNCLNTNQ